ncbi:MAG: hypothetical protein AUH84_05465 [Thaumarchaeota archaeon 13_1_40CM_4_38_7]|nr:MAG: hypothetical protein AUH84_05465 [Thaumarchaeota archaeon 13_1_40CM_4_38_7]OLD27595.1 MAG: hypothetical protein AUI62_05555 [Thaumarchaeota archaeon 13_1_40CM_2_39_7]
MLLKGCKFKEGRLVKPKKASVITVILAALGLVFTVVGMFTFSQDKVILGIVFWVASVISGRFIKKKPIAKN